MGRIANHKRDTYFLKLVHKGILHVSKKGTVTNTLTGTVFGQNKNFDYQRVSYYDRKTKRIRKCKIHRLMLLVFNGPIPDGFEPNHKDGIKHNNKLSNLELVTYSGNMQHAYDTGLKKKMFGEDNGLSKLTEKDIKHIFRLRKSLWSKSEIARKFGVTYVTIRYILAGKTWASVKGRPNKSLKVPHKKSGTDNGRAKLTEKDVIHIRNNLAGRFTSGKIARKYCVSSALIQKIIKRDLWKHI